MIRSPATSTRLTNPTPAVASRLINTARRIECSSVSCGDAAMQTKPMLTAIDGSTPQPTTRVLLWPMATTRRMPTIVDMLRTFCVVSKV